MPRISVSRTFIDDGYKVYRKVPHARRRLLESAQYYFRCVLVNKFTDESRRLKIR